MKNVDIPYTSQVLISKSRENVKGVYNRESILKSKVKCNYCSIKFRQMNNEKMRIRGINI